MCRRQFNNYLSIQISDSKVQTIDKIFTLPVKYLPKKKKENILKSGKPKLPVVATSQEWINMQLEKEKLKEEEEKKSWKKEICRAKEKNGGGKKENTRKN